MQKVARDGDPNMRKLAYLAAAAAFVFSTGSALAEGEGNVEPNFFSAERTVVRGQAFVTDTSTEAYPATTGNSGRGSSLVQLEPAPGSETVVQTAGSLPRDAGASTRFA